MPSFIIVVGASAGGLDVLCKLASTFPDGLDAAIFIVLHLSSQSNDHFLTTRLQQYTSLPCELAQDGLPIQKGHIYIAAVDHHLIVKQSNMYITQGPAENRWRPSIDVLFRAAAVYYNERAIGIILTGLLDDGTLGMQAIQQCGGTCIVQDPREATFPDMPQSVLENTMVDFVLPVNGMSEVIQHTISNKRVSGVEVPEYLKAEAAMVEKTITAIDEVSKLGKHTVYSCPDCGGGLWEINEGEQAHMRCHIGHVYTENELLSKQFESLNGTLWVALRMMEERRNLLKKISNDEKTKNLHGLATMHTERAKELETHIKNLKELLFNVKFD